MQKLWSGLAIVLGLAVSAIGLLGVVSPSALVDFARSLQTSTALYVVAAVRVGIGAVLLLAAPGSRLPGLLRVLGVFVIVAGILTPVFGVERSREMLDWFTTHSPLFLRAWAGVALAFGLLVVYAAWPPPDKSRPAETRHL